MSEIRFDGRVAVITGAGGGLGRTYALELARRGAQVVVNDLGGAPDGSGKCELDGRPTVNEIKAAGGQAVANYDSVATPAGRRGDHQDRARRLRPRRHRDQQRRHPARQELREARAAGPRDRPRRAPEGRASTCRQPAFRAMKEQGYGRFLFTASAAGIFGNFGQTQLRRRQDGPRRPLERARRRGREEQHQVERDRADREARGSPRTCSARSRARSSPTTVTPLACYLVSEACELTHEVFSVGGGRFARIFVGLAPGWFAGKGKVGLARGRARPPGPDHGREELHRAQEHRRRDASHRQGPRWAEERRHADRSREGARREARADARASGARTR